MSDLLTTAEVGRILLNDPSTVALWCQAGKVEGAFRTPGGQWRIPRASVEKILAGEQK